MKAAYHRLLIKLSGGQLAGENGFGINPLWFSQVSPAIIGKNWQTTVNIAAPGANSSLVRIFFGGPLLGAVLGIGELLCAPPSLPSNVAAGFHSIPVPSDCTLVGLTFCTQAATVTSIPFTIRLTNALDITIGSF